MESNNASGRLVGSSVFAAIAASLCCITPVLALLAGTSGLASAFSWLEPARPYLIGLTVAVLGFAWYQKLKPIPVDDCGCEVEKTSFLQTRSFLGIITVFTGLMLAFPLYSHVFYPTQNKEVIVVDAADLQTVTFTVTGMTCTGCENHVKHAVNELPGIVGVEASYDNGNAIVKFDKTKTSIEDIQAAIDGTGYKATEYELSGN